MTEQLVRTDGRGSTDADPPESVESTEPDDVDDPTAHLDGLEDGAGCAEIWEHLSDRRGDD